MRQIAVSLPALLGAWRWHHQRERRLGSYFVDFESSALVLGGSGLAARVNQVRSCGSGSSCRASL